MGFKEIWCNDLDWIKLAPEVQWWAFVNMVIDLTPKTVGTF
jgi:hypothetical protein